MRYRLRKALALSVSLCLTIALVIVPMQQTSYADGSYPSVKYAKTMHVMLDPKTPNRYYVEMGKKADSAVKITVTSGNRKVAVPEKYDNSIIHAKRAGTAKLKIKVKTKKGTKTYKCTLKVLKYENPFKTLKVGGTSLKSKFNKTAQANSYVKNKTTGKIKIVPKKGWVLKRAYYSCEYYGDDYEHYDQYEPVEYKFTKKNIKSVPKLTLYPKGNDWEVYMYFTMENPKLGISMDFWLDR